LGLGFFGLTLTSAKVQRNNVFSQIHEIVFHGKGGFSWGEVYNMPIWLRNFTFNKIKTFYDDEAKRTEAMHKKQDSNVTKVIGKDGKISAPQFLNKASYK
jgi:hypothetical protein